MSQAEIINQIHELQKQIHKLEQEFQSLCQHPVFSKDEGEGDRGLKEVFYKCICCGKSFYYSGDTYETIRNPVLERKVVQFYHFHGIGAYQPEHLQRIIDSLK